MGAGNIALLTSEQVQQMDTNMILEYSYRRFGNQFRSICCEILWALMSLCCTYCCPPYPPIIARKVAYEPPKPPTYRIVKHIISKKVVVVKVIPCPALKRIWSDTVGDYAQISDRYSAYQGYTKTGNSIICLHVKNVRRQPSPFTILYSQGNGSDLGWTMLEMQDFSDILGLDVMAYDYSGYGRSSGRFSETNMCRSAEVALDCLINKVGCPMNRIILWGMSLGTVSTCYLGSRFTPAAVIIQSGFLSSLRYCFPCIKNDYRLDSFCNYKRIRGVTAPTLIIHGAYDRLFDMDHAYGLAKECAGLKEVIIIPDSDHDTLNLSTTYWISIMKFLKANLDLTPIFENEEELSAKLNAGRQFMSSRINQSSSDKARTANRRRV